MAFLAYFNVSNNLLHSPSGIDEIASVDQILYFCLEVLIRTPELSVLS